MGDSDTKPTLRIRPFSAARTIAIIRNDSRHDFLASALHEHASLPVIDVYYSSTFPLSFYAFVQAFLARPTVLPRLLIWIIYSHFAAFITSPIADRPFYSIFYSVFRQSLSLSLYLTAQNVRVVTVFEAGLSLPPHVIISLRVLSLKTYTVPYGFGKSQDVVTSVHNQSLTDERYFTSGHQRSYLARITDPNPYIIKCTSASSLWLLPFHILHPYLCLDYHLDIPAYVNGGFSPHEELLVEDLFMLNHYKSQGRTYRLRLSGSPLHNHFACGRLSYFRTNTDRILISLPPIYADRWHLSAYKDLSEAFADLKSFLDTLPKSIVLISFHPESNRNDLITELKRHNLPYEPYDLVSNLPFVDLFISVGSSTIRYASQHGIKCINWNLFGFDMTEYRELSVTVAEFSSLQNSSISSYLNQKATNTLYTTDFFASFNSLIH